MLGLKGFVDFNSDGLNGVLGFVAENKNLELCF
jgi:hypothetical protein